MRRDPREDRSLEELLYCLRRVPGVQHGSVRMLPPLIVETAAAAQRCRRCIIGARIWHVDATLSASGMTEMAFGHSPRSACLKLLRRLRLLANVRTT